MSCNWNLKLIKHPTTSQDVLSYNNKYHVPLEGYDNKFLREDAVIVTFLPDGKISEARRKLYGGERVKCHVIQNGKRTIKPLARLLAEGLLPNPGGLPHVLFLDRDKENCSISNLYWGNGNSDVRNVPGREQKPLRKGSDLLGYHGIRVPFLPSKAEEEQIELLTRYYFPLLKKEKTFRRDKLVELWSIYGMTLTVISEWRKVAITTNADISACPRAKMLSGARVRARQLNLPYDLSIEDVFLTTHCPYLEVKLNYNAKTSMTANSPSLDRIIPELGYVKGNIRVISYKANAMKNQASIEELHAFANTVFRKFGM